ncbi:MAG: hypothetical protein PHW73_10710 [Atribacterota bacterium]|nr:hypothetical protein [Atribacterota bacterium]
MEECPNCKKWTLSYDPRTEMKFCFDCKFIEHLSYDRFIDQENVIDLLRYPGNTEVERNKQIMVVKTATF